MMAHSVDKNKMKDSKNRPITQSLFLEIGYKEEFAAYTLKEEDFTYKGKVYPSLKRLYLEMEDVVEYEFATKYLLGWSHWKRLEQNKLLTPHIEAWREELELKIRSQGVRAMMDKVDKSPMAAKWLADKGWGEKKAGRPSKLEKEAQLKFEEQISSDFSADIIRLG